MMGSSYRDIRNRIGQEKMAQLIELGRICEAKKGQLLFEEKEETGLCLLLEGYVSLFRESRTGENRIIFICGPGELLNETVLENGIPGVSAKALSACRFLELDPERIWEEMAASWELGRAVCASLARKTRRLYHQAGNTCGNYALEDHLTARLWKLARDYGIAEEGGRRIPFDISVTMLSDMLGAKRESVSRLISAMKGSGLICMEKGSLLIPDMEKLREKMSV